MGYKEVLIAAGVKVTDFEQFGSYQGTWIARVENGFIFGSYGSCSGCDSFEAEFGFRYDEEIPKEELAEFGRSYVENVLTYEQAIKEASRDLEWDLGAQEVIDWIKKHK